MRSEGFSSDHQSGASQRITIKTLADYAERRREIELLFQRMPAVVPAPGNPVWERFAAVANALGDFEKANGMRIRPP